MADEPTNRELENLIKRNHTDSTNALTDLKNHVDAQFRLYLLRDVYDAREEARAIREAAQDSRMDRMEEDADSDRREAAEHRRSKWERFWIVTAAIAGGVATVVMTVILTHGGGHA